MGFSVIRTGAISLTLLAAVSIPAWTHSIADTSQRLAKIGPAANIELTAQSGNPFSLAQTRGKIVAVSFTFTKCTDTCPMLSATMVRVQNALGADFGSEVFFVTVTMDPEADRPEALKRYAEAIGSNLEGWAFLTGTETEIASVARDYGIFRMKSSDGEVEHTLLTTIIDREGISRVQYMGMHFDPDEFLHDLRLLIDEEDPA